MFELRIKDHIAAAHFLRDYEGKCANLHGHTWHVEVVVEAEELDETGMVVDFVLLKEKIKALLEELDHKCFNELEYFKEVNPTSENIAKYIYDRLKPELPCKLKEIVLWESPVTSAKYYE